MSRFSRPLLALACAISLASAAPASAATITIINADSAGEGLNDPTVVAPVGGNTGTTRGQQRLNVLQHAAAIWGGILESSVPIRVQARFDPLACDASSAELGSGGPGYAVSLTLPNALPDTWYPAALANKLSGNDTNFFLDDVVLTITRSLDGGCTFPRSMYYGLDAAGDPGTTFDAVTVALRELAHGLGFYTFVDVTTGNLFAGKNDIFMTFLEDHSTGLTWDQMTNGERAASAIDTGDLHWIGERVLDSIGILGAGADQGHVLMHAPPVAAPGATAIFWDASLSPDQLLEPSPAGAEHDPGLARAVMADIGWTLETCGNGVEEIGEICDAAGECCTATCGYANAGSVCDNGSFCDGTETCDASGGCTGTSSGDPCAALVGDGDIDCSETCDEDSDSCTGNDPDLDVCDDEDICSPSSQCQSGTCVGFGDNLCLIDPYVAYKAGAPRTDPLGQSLDSTLPKPWVIKVDDFHLDDVDDPENFEVKKAKSLLNPALEGAAVTFEDPDLNYIRYQMKPGKQGAGAVLDNGNLPKAAKHVPRAWELANDLGNIRVKSKKVSALLLPAASQEGAPPAAPGVKTHFVCYQVKVTDDVTAQTPDSGDGTGRLRSDLQVFVADEFDDCALNQNGTPGFDGTPVEGRCLVDLRRVTEFCSPIDVGIVDTGRETAADSGAMAAQTDVGLLCYQARLARQILNASAASLAGATVGQSIDPKQRKHVKRRYKDGNPLFTAPGNSFDAPSVMQSTGLDSVCLPTTVVSVAPLP